MRLVGPDPARVDDATPKSYLDAQLLQLRSYVDTRTAQKVAGVVLDFGSDEGGTSATATVFASWATTGLAVTCVPDPAGTADHGAEDAAVEGVIAVVTYVEPGIGFDVVAVCPGGTWGRYLFNCLA